MIGVVVPAHNEAELLGACLQSIAACSRDPLLNGERVEVVVVLDACTDSSLQVAMEHGADAIAINARNVGAARALGCKRLLLRGATWLACTDADTRVAPNWLSTQLRLGADAVCGSIGVHWTEGMERVRLEHERHYVDAEGHRHIHGANMGMSARAYQRAGGFRALRSSEDVALVRALESSGASVHWSAAPRVVTSARLTPRTSGGFGNDLAKVARELVPQLLQDNCGAANCA